MKMATTASKTKVQFGNAKQVSLRPYLVEETITPEIAQEYLDSRGELRNRAINGRRVDELCRRILAGEWEIGQSIAFDILGRLYDGQHRLSAVIKAGIPVSMLVVRNMPVEAIGVTDLGQSRNASQIAAVLGHPLNAKAQSILRALMISGDQYKNISPQRYMELYDLHREAMEFVLQFPLTTKKLKGTHILLAAAVKAWHYEDPDKLLRMLAFIEDMNAVPVSDIDKTANSIRYIFIAERGTARNNMSIYDNINLLRKACIGIESYCLGKVITQINARKPKDSPLLKDVYPLPAFTNEDDKDAWRLMHKFMRKDAQLTANDGYPILYPY